MKRSCPICGKPVDSATSPDFPFCGERCHLMDLGNWSSGEYVISESAFDESMFEDLERDLEDSPGRSPSDADGHE